MKRSTILLSMILLFVASPAAWGAGAPKVSSQANLTPKQRAAQSFNQGIDHRDKAWKYEKALATETDARKVTKLEAKIRKEYEKAIKDYEAAIKLDPNMFPAHGSLGYALRKTGDYENALVSYDRALTIMPGYAEAIEYRAEAYLGLDRLSDAKVAYLTLLNGGSDRAAELLTAMRKHVDQQQSKGVDVAEFAEWVSKRESLVGMKGATAASGGGSW